MNWLSSPSSLQSSETELSLEECLYHAVIRQDVDAVTSFLAQGANPNKTTCHGQTCLGAASHTGNVTILKQLIDRSGPSTNVDISSPYRKRHHRSHKRRLDRSSMSSEDGSSKYKIGDIYEGSPNYTRFLPRDVLGCRNHGYYVFIHEDGSANDERITASSLSTPSTPSPLADLEWDEDVGNIAPSTREDETWSSLYKWYAAILECTGAALACAAAIPTGIDHQDAFTKTAVHYASEEGQVAALEMLLDAGCKVDISAGDGFTPLHGAAMRGHSAAMRLLLNAGARVNCATNENMTALHYAASRGYLELVEMLVQAGASLEARDTSERTALFLSAGHGHEDVLSYLIESGANVNVEEIHGHTPLCEAVWQRHVSAVKELLDAGARVTHSHRLLHNAVLQRQEEIVHLLAMAGGINLHDDNGDTPLLLAARTSQPDIARILLKFGANVNSSDSITGAAAVHVAIARIDAPKELEEMLIDLLDYGGDINTTSLYGDTALNRAILLHRDHAVVLLVRHGADPNLCYLQACALDNLTLVGRRRSPTLARILVKAGHDLPAPAPNQTPAKTGTAAEYIFHASRNPLTLTDLCRLNLRQLPQRMPLYRFIGALPLPKRLISFLMLEDEG